MKPEQAREQIRFRLKSMAEHPGSMDELIDSVMALFYLMAPDQELGRALSSPCGGRKVLVEVDAETFGTTLKFPRPLTELPPQGTPVRVIILADEP